MTEHLCEAVTGSDVAATKAAALARKEQREAQGWTWIGARTRLRQSPPEIVLTFYKPTEGVPV